MPEGTMNACAVAGHFSISENVQTFRQESPVPFYAPAPRLACTSNAGKCPNQKETPFFLNLFDRKGHRISENYCGKLRPKL
jgi:hypothetical protein